ncbi:hypothetical protein TNCV_362491 [Trichonephila clavipes]|nr:hypothetical protein TNCV_362491 [Trichonephila clavipes]
MHEEIEQQLRLNSDPPSLQAPEGWYQGQPYVEGFTNVVFMRGDQPFTSHSHHAIDENNDYATSHRARIMDAYLEKQAIQRIQRPARSPDLNLI